MMRQRVSSIPLVMCVVVAMVSGSRQTSPDPLDGLDVMFGIGSRYENSGEYPAVALNEKDVLIEVHRHPDRGGIFYRLGKIDDFLTVDFHAHDALALDRAGSKPVVAINNRNQLVVAYITNSTAICRVGTADPAAGTVTWGDPVAYADAERASVALGDDGSFLLVYSADTHNALVKSLSYVVGQILPGTERIRFRDEKGTRFASGRHPSVAIDHRSGRVVEVHRGTTILSNRLWYAEGTLDSKNGTIDWRKSVDFDEGFAPSVCINDDGLIVEVHQTTEDAVGLAQLV